MMAVGDIRTFYITLRMLLQHFFLLCRAVPAGQGGGLLLSRSTVDDRTQNSLGMFRSAQQCSSEDGCVCVWCVERPARTYFLLKNRSIVPASRGGPLLYGGVDECPHLSFAQPLEHSSSSSRQQCGPRQLWKRHAAIMHTSSLAMINLWFIALFTRAQQSPDSETCSVIPRFV